MSSWLAKAAIRAQLDELMGKDRDEPLDSNKKPPHWSDPEYCKDYLLKFCPHELFRNTKSDLGPCSKEHDDRMRDEFQQQADAMTRYNYSHDLLRNLENLVIQLDRQIERAQDRVTQQKVNLNEEQQNRVNEIIEEVKRLQIVMSDSGEEGDVQKCMEIMEKIQGLKDEREAIESGNTTIRTLYGEKRQSVCVICGAISQISDNDSRLLAHFEGKQHQGYLKVRVGVEELKKDLENLRREAQNERERAKEKEKEGPTDDRRERDRDDYNIRDEYERKDDRRGGGNDDRRERDYEEKRDDRRGGGYDDNRRDDRRGGGYDDNRRDDRRGGGYDNRRDDRRGYDDRRDDRRGGGGYDDRRERDRRSSRGNDGYGDRRERDRSPERRDTRRERDRSPDRY